MCQRPPGSQNTNPVGASLLAKAVFKPIKMHRMSRPLRKQARLPQGQCQGQNRNQPPDHRGRSVQGCYLPNEHQTVGASLLAKAVFKPIKMHRMYWPLREQARSHRVNVRVRIGTSRPITEAGRCRTVIYRTNTKPWEQACLRRRYSSRKRCIGCTGLFASKLAPTGSGSTPDHAFLS